MANDIAKVARTAEKAFVDTLSQSTDKWRPAVRVHTDDTPSLQLGAYVGTGLLGSAQGAGQTPADIDTVQSVITSSHKDKLYRLNWDEIADSDSAVANISAILANEASATVQNIVEAGVTGLPSLDHPLQGDRGVGGGIKFADTGINYGGLGSGTTQDNLLAIGFSRAAVNAGLKILREYRNQAGVQLHMGDRVNLIVGPENEEEAFAIARSGMSSDQMQASQIPQRVAGVSVLTSMGNDWALVDDMANPLVLHLRRLPRIVVTPTDDGLGVNFAATLTATFGVMPSEAGLVYSQVA
jgi:hypothetical protein